MSIPAFNRILLKLSGEILAGDRGYGIEPAITNEICNKIKTVVNEIFNHNTTTTTSITMTTSPTTTPPYCSIEYVFLFFLLAMNECAF